MKHLKRYSVIHTLLEKSNEGLNDNEVAELRDFCETSLAYLLDEGYQVDINEYIAPRDEWSDGFDVDLNLPNGRLEHGYAGSTFLWDDIKDYYIPFLQLLSRRYKLGHYGFDHDSEVYFRGPVEFATVERVIYDNLPSSYQLFGIGIKVISKI